MNLKADVESIGRLATLMGRAGYAASTFASANTGAGPNELGEGLLGMLAGPLDRWQALGLANCQRAATLADLCDAALVEAAKYYVAADDAAEARLDGAFPAAASQRVPREQVSAPETAGDFSDVEDAWRDPHDPEFRYTAPPEPAENAGRGWDFDLDGEVDKLTGAASVAPYVRDLLRWLVGWDPFTAISTLVAGDWKGLMRQGSVFEDTAIAFGRIKQNVDRGRYAIQDKWDGNAAAALENWLAAYSQACADQAKFCVDAGWKIKNFARSAFHAFQALNIALDTLIDAVLDALLKGRGLGPAVGGVVNAIRGEGPKSVFAAVVCSVLPIADILDQVRMVAHGIQSAAEMVAGNGEVAERAWPGEPYRHPGFR